MAGRQLTWDVINQPRRRRWESDADRDWHMTGIKHWAGHGWTCPVPDQARRAMLRLRQAVRTPSPSSSHPLSTSHSIALSALSPGGTSLLYYVLWRSTLALNAWLNFTTNGLGSKTTYTHTRTSSHAHLHMHNCMYAYLNGEAKRSYHFHMTIWRLYATFVLDIHMPIFWLSCSAVTSSLAVNTVRPLHTKGTWYWTWYTMAMWEIACFIVSNGQSNSDIWSVGIVKFLYFYDYISNFLLVLI